MKQSSYQKLKEENKRLNEALTIITTHPESSEACIIADMFRVREHQKNWSANCQLIRDKNRKFMDGAFGHTGTSFAVIDWSMLPKKPFLPDDVAGMDFDLKLSDEQIKVAEWVKNMIDGIVKIHESLNQFNDGYRELLEKTLTPEWCIYQLFDKGIITIEEYLNKKGLSDLEKIEFLESLNKTI